MGALGAHFRDEARARWTRDHPKDAMPVAMAEFYGNFADAKASRESLDVEPTWRLETSFRYDFGGDYAQFERLVPIVDVGGARIGTSLRVHLYTPDHRTWSSAGERSDGGPPIPRTGGRGNRERLDVERFDDSEYLRLARKLPRQLLTELEDHGGRWAVERSGGVLQLTCDFGAPSSAEPVMGLFVATVAGTLSVRIDGKLGLPVALRLVDGFGHAVHEVSLGAFHADEHGVLPTEVEERTWWPASPPRPRTVQRIHVRVEAARPAFPEALLLPPGTKVQDERLQPAVVYTETPVPRTLAEIAAASAKAAESRTLRKTDARPTPAIRPPGSVPATAPEAPRVPWWSHRAAVAGITFVAVLGLLAGLRSRARRTRRARA